MQGELSVESNLIFIFMLQRVVSCTHEYHLLVKMFCARLCIPPRWPSGKVSASRAEGPGFESRLRRDFFGVESYQ